MAPILHAVTKRTQRFTVKQARLRLGLSQQALAARAGTDQADISRLELGKVTEPLFSKGLKIADALELDPHHLQFGAEESAA